MPNYVKYINIMGSGDGNLPINPYNVINPDFLEGSTDTQKIQNSINAFENSGGAIILTRMYDIENNITIPQHTNKNKCAPVNIIGIGEHSGFYMNPTASFISSATGNRIPNGGIRFTNVFFESTGTPKTQGTCFNTSNLIRMTFDNCYFYGFLYCFYGVQNPLQSWYISNSYFWRVGNMLYHTGDGVWNFVLRDSICEQSDNGIKFDSASGSYGIYNVLIDGCCLEGFSQTAIEIPQNAKEFTIQNCYFEENNPTIIYRHTTLQRSVNILNNLFIPGSDEIPIIVNGTATSPEKQAFITGNYVDNDSNLIELPSTAGDGTYCYDIRNNTGGIVNPLKLAILPEDFQIATFTQSGVVFSNANRQQVIRTISDLRSEYGSNVRFVGAFVNYLATSIGHTSGLTLSFNSNGDLCGTVPTTDTYNYTITLLYYRGA